MSDIIIVAIHKEGRTIIMVTHDKDIAVYADRIIEISDGKILNSEAQIANGHVKGAELRLEK